MTEEQYQECLTALKGTKVTPMVIHKNITELYRYYNTHQFLNPDIYHIVITLKQHLAFLMRQQLKQQFNNDNYNYVINVILEEVSHILAKTSSSLELYRLELYNVMSKTIVKLDVHKHELFIQTSKYKYKSTVVEKSRHLYQVLLVALEKIIWN